MAKLGVKLGPSDFVHLHNHTHYSLLDGLTKVPQLVERVKGLGMKAVAITDHGSMSGVVELYKAATDAGTKPIIGMEAYVAPRTHLDKDPAKDRQVFHLTMLAESSEALAQGSYESAKQTAAWYKEVFGDRYYIELADHGHPQHPTCWDQQTRVNEQLLKIAEELNLSTVVTCDAHYLNKDDKQAHEVLLCV